MIVKKITLFIVISLFTFLQVNAQTPVEKHGQLRVQGNRIVDKNGKPVQLQGMSLYWSMWKPAFYNASCVKWLRDDWCVTVVRAAMGVDYQGYATNPTTERNRITTVIDACIANGIYVIVDFHEHDAPKFASQARTFFNEISLKYKDVPNIIYETWNEPLAVSWANVIKPYHQDIVNVIRKNDPDNIIICGTANWSQRVGDPANDPVSGGNIAYTLHYYADSHKEWLRTAAKAALDKGIALFVTEYGTCAADGGGSINEVESKAWWKFMEDNYISHCNWSIADLGETSAALKTGTGATGNWPISALKPSGVLVRNYLKSRCNTVISNDPIPTITITSPTNNSTSCTGSDITISATAAVTGGAITKVDFYNGNTLIGTDNSSPYSFTWNKPAAGTYTLRAIATSSTNTTSTAATVSVEVTANPTITPYSNVNDSEWLEKANVELCEGGKVMYGPHPHDVTTGWSWKGPNNFTATTREITLNNIKTSQSGTYTVTFTDANNCSAATEVKVTTQANPTVKITSPTTNEVLTTSTRTTHVMLKSTATGTNITSVSYFEGSELIGTNQNAPYSYEWTGLSAGLYQNITAKATTQLGCVGTSQPINFEVTTVTSLDENLTTNIKLYPNPATSSIFIEGDFEGEWIIYNVLGEELQKGLSNELVIDQLSSGIYHLKINNQVKKFVKK